MKWFPHQKLSVYAAVMTLATALSVISPAGANSSITPITINFSGTLSTDYCSVEDSPATVSFSSVSIKNIYDAAWPVKSFSVGLKCHGEAGNSVALRLTGSSTGTETPLLAVNGVSGLGIRIALKDGDKALQPGGKPVNYYVTADGQQKVEFTASLQGLTDAINQHNVGTGNFTAIATLVISQS